MRIAPDMSSTPRSRRSRGRFVVWLLVAAACFAGVWQWSYRRSIERSRVIESIVAAGGRFGAAAEESVLDRLQLLLFGERATGDEVALEGQNFDDAWLAAHNDLRSLDIRELMIRDTRLSHAAVVRLVERHSLDYLGAAGVPFTDEDAERIGRQEHLTGLVLMQSELTDTGLAALRPQRLRALNIAGTRVTSAALQRELAGAGQLGYLVVDGRQFTPELAAQLAQMKSVYMLSLIGPDVTDEHVKLLESMQNLRYIRLEETTASEAAIAALRTARSTPTTIDVAPPAPSFFTWRSEKAR